MQQTMVDELLELLAVALVPRADKLDGHVSIEVKTLIRTSHIEQTPGCLSKPVAAN